MYSSATTFIERLNAGRVPRRPLLRWGCPIPYFGDPTSAWVATVGINPSSREFVGKTGLALSGVEQRLPTLDSLGLASWDEMHSSHIRAVAGACRTYFVRNPYISWFRPLETIVSGGDASFFGSDPSACHLDLIPYATRQRWGILPPATQQALLRSCEDALGLLLREFPIEILVLNGRTVVKHFEEITNSRLSAESKESWVLPRTQRGPVPGISYEGHVQRIGSVELGRQVKVLGYNHNLQSSFGVTTAVVNAISRWVGLKGAQEH
jgi:hypothetical protein